MQSEKIIIGSHALRKWFPEFNRVPKDIDYLVADKSLYKSTRTEEYFENPVIFNNQDKYTKDGYILPSVLYTLKISHVIGYDIFWSKNIWDVQFLKEQGCKVIPQLLEELIAYWETVHGPVKRSDLSMSAEDFFNNALPDGHLHDSLHLILNPVPTYLKVLRDGCEVDVCPDKFNALSHTDKCNLLYEEVCLMSFERKFHKDYRISYSRMLKKFILQHAAPWYAVWIVQNHKELSRAPYDYYTKIDNALKQQLCTAI